MNITKGLKCENVLKFFEDICAIPHGSGNTGMIADYCVDFAKKNNLWYHRDELNNVIIKKDAYPGYENSPVVVIQGHLDMVCEKTEDKVIDFEKEAITLKYEDGYLFADRTTLGGDDGIAIAYALAILEDDSIEHPAVEAVFTVDEETDMNGAKGIDTSLIDGRLLLNIDSECEGVFTVSSAGTNVVRCTFENEYVPVSGCEYVIKIGGLYGGHSGVEIHKGRANAIALMGRVLYRLSNVCDISIVSVNGGAKDNAIASLCEVRFVADPRNEEALEKEVSLLSAEFNNEYSNIEKSVEVSLRKSENEVKSAFSDSATKNIIAFLYSMINGVVAMSSEIEGLVKTSLNCGIVKTDSGCVTVSFLVRSSLESEMTAVSGKIICLARALGAKGELISASPAWEYKSDSILREVCKKAYENCYGKSPVIEAIHAGLECGIFSQRIAGIDCISYGPDIHDIHTPKERLSVESVDRVWNFTLEVLKLLK